MILITFLKKSANNKLFITISDMKNVTISKLASAPKVEEIKPETVVEQTPEPKAEETKPEDGLCMCPMCEGSGKVKAEDKPEEKAEEEKPVEDEHKADSKDGDPEPEEEKTDEVVKAEDKKEDVYAKGKSLKNADMSDVFKKDYISPSRKAFVEDLYKSFGAEDYMPKL